MKVGVLSCLRDDCEATREDERGSHYGTVLCSLKCLAANVSAIVLLPEPDSPITTITDSEVECEFGVKVSVATVGSAPLRDSPRVPCEPVSVCNRTGLRPAEREIEKWRPETGAQNPPRTDRNTENYRPETGIRPRNPRECRRFSPTGK